MKSTFYLLFICLLVASASCKQEQNKQAQHDEHLSASSSEEPAAKKPLSPKTKTMGNIGEAHVHIDYSSPGVRGRTIWGGLVAFDQVWVTGAHKATSIDFNKDLVINGQTVPAGTYGFFTIPAKEEWTIILNKNHQQHLADDYNPAEDVLRFKVVPQQLPEIVEALTYEVNAGEGNKGSISVMWEYIKVSFDVEVL